MRRGASSTPLSCGGPRLTRRDALRYAGAVGSAVLGTSALVSGCRRADGPVELLLAAGEAGGFYLEFAQLLAARLNQDGLPSSPRPTGGSAQNIAMVRDGSAMIGLALADVALSAWRGVQSPFPEPIDLRSLGRVYENYVQLLVRDEDPIWSVHELAGRPVSLGTVGSGASLFATRLLEATGVSVRRYSLRLQDAISALEGCQIDAMLWSGGIPTPALAALAQRRRVRLVDLGGELMRMRSRHGPVYGSVTVPSGVYGHEAAQSTIGVSNLLVCRTDLSANLAESVAMTLVAAGPELVPATALGTQYLGRPSLIDTGGLPLHDGAADGYRSMHG